MEGRERASLQRDAHFGDEEIEQETTKVAFRAIKNKNSTREWGGGGGGQCWSVIEKNNSLLLIYF
jgi:hypothetical protein